MNNPDCNTTLRRSFPDAEWRDPERLVLTPGDEPILVEKCFLRFEKWTGQPISEKLHRLYGSKAVVHCEGQAAFAELAILQLLRNAGFDGRWVANWGGLRFWVKPWDTLELPVFAQEAYDKIVQAKGGSGGFWDVMAWKAGQYIFAESKQVTKRYSDRLQENQEEWLNAALSIEEIRSSSCFVICYWDFQ
jgi:hypothetical protein